MEKVIFKRVQLDFRITKVIEDFGKACFELVAKKTDTARIRKNYKSNRETDLTGFFSDIRRYTPPRKQAIDTCGGPLNSNFPKYQKHLNVNRNFVWPTTKRKAHLADYIVFDPDLLGVNPACGIV